MHNHWTVLQSTVISQGFDEILHNKTFISEEAFRRDIESMCIKIELNSLYIIAKMFVTLKIDFIVISKLKMKDCICLYNSTF